MKDIADGDGQHHEADQDDHARQPRALEVSAELLDADGRHPAITDRNAAGVQETRGSTDDLMAQAKRCTRADGHGGPANGANGRRVAAASARADSATVPGDIGIFTTDTRSIVRTWDAWLAAATGIAARRMPSAGH